jgi:putative nucleotidyltransferase with HDIG domain
MGRVYPFWVTMQAISEALERVSPLGRVGNPVDGRMLSYLVSLATSAILLLWIAIAIYGVAPNPWPVAALAVVAAVAERWSARLGENLEASVSLVAMVFAAVLFGPVESLLVAAASTSGDFRPPFMRWGVYTSSRALTGGVTGIVAQAALDIPANGVAATAVAAVVGAFVATTLDISFTAVTMRLRGKASISSVVKMLGPAVVASVPLYAPLVALLVIAYQELSAWTMPLFFVPALGAQRLFVLYEHQRQLAEDVIATNKALERANLSFAAALVAALDARDQYTAGHSAAVALYARDIAERMGLSDEDQRLAHLCGLVHDIGKIGLPPGLLEKPGALTLEERRQMQLHSEIGERILSKWDRHAEISKIIRHHHERVDGEGYPDGLSESETPLISRIISVADAYNAMTSNRPYRDAMPSRVARLRLAQAADSQFDTSVVAAFEAILAGASEDYRRGAGERFTIHAQEEFSLGDTARAA